MICDKPIVRRPPFEQDIEIGDPVGMVPLESWDLHT